MASVIYYAPWSDFAVRTQDRCDLFRRRKLPQTGRPHPPIPGRRAARSRRSVHPGSGRPHAHSLRRQHGQAAYPQPAQPVNHGFARTAALVCPGTSPSCHPEWPWPLRLCQPHTFRHRSVPAARFRCPRDPVDSFRRQSTFRQFPEGLAGICPADHTPRYRNSRLRERRPCLPTRLSGQSGARTAAT